MKKIIMICLSALLVLTLNACSSDDSNNGGNENKPIVLKSEKVDITIDNWQDYFEIVESTYVSKNEFDEPAYVYPSINLVLKKGIELAKNEYGTINDYEIDVEFTYTTAYYNVDMDLENGTLTIKDLYDGEPKQKTSTKTLFHDMNNFYMSYNTTARGGVVFAMEIMSDVVITNIQGTIEIQK